jgi:hypothetical protein
MNPPEVVVNKIPPCLSLQKGGIPSLEKRAQGRFAAISPLNYGLIGRKQKTLFASRVCIILGGRTVIPKAGIRDSPVVEVLPLNGCPLSRACQIMTQPLERRDKFVSIRKSNASPPLRWGRSEGKGYRMKPN